ncbi:MAG: hypothetical protein PVG51_07365 [Desulfosarcina sp.]|jgi:hypothetical protein
MRATKLFRKKSFILLSLLLAGLVAGAAQAAITPVAPYQATVLDDPDPGVIAYGSSIGLYDNKIIYAGTDGNIYAYDVSTGSSTLVSDTAALTLFGVQGFLVASDGYLYFHDNGTSANVYRLNLADPWPAAYETLDSLLTSSIYGFTENPWTKTVWIASADFPGPNFYLDEIYSTFSIVRPRAVFAKPNSGGNGPIIFKGPNTLLYGESIFGGNGFFHLVNTSTGEVFEENYITVTGGLADAAYGYNNEIFATSGGGSSILQIQGAATSAIGTTDGEARGLQFGGGTFYLSEMVPFGTGASDGASSFNSLTNPSAVTAITSQGDFQAALLVEPSVAVFTYSSSLTYYAGQILYAGTDGNIYAYSLNTGASTLVSDTSSLATAFSSVQGFLVASDGYLYFHDNGSSANIYRLNLSDAWPAAYSELDTAITSSIFAFAENPFDGTIWFSSADFFGSGNNFYLYQVDAGFAGVTEKAVFTQPNSGGNGPIVFTALDTLLYGESVFGGDGYFHQVDTTSGQVTQAEYLTFSGGLVSATRGYDDTIYVTSGGGKTVYELDGNQKTAVATTGNDAQGIVFDGASLLISDLVPFGTGATDGTVGLLQLWQQRRSGVPSGQEVADTVDLNDDGIPDVDQPDVILSANAAGAGGAKQVGVSSNDIDVVIDSVEAVDPATISNTSGKPDNLPFGLVNFRATVATPGDTVQVTVYLSEAAPLGARWYKYNAIDGWQDYSDHATFSPDRRSVVLELQDGGFGDADRVVNSEVLDPGGVGVAASSSGGGGGGCFIGTAENAVNTNGFPLPAIFLLVAGIVLVGIFRSAIARSV